MKNLKMDDTVIADIGSIRNDNRGHYIIYGNISHVNNDETYDVTETGIGPTWVNIKESRIMLISDVLKREILKDTCRL